METNYIKLEDSYLQYTKDMKPLQRGRVEKSLDSLIRIKDIGVLKEKEWYVHEYLKGCQLEYIKDYVGYSKRTGEPLKPKDEYRMKIKGGSFYTITKTGYEFIQYLQKLGAKEKDILGCVQIEKKMKEKEDQLKQQQKQAEREKQEQEKQQRKQEFNAKKEEYIKIGRPLIEPHREMIRKELENFASIHGADIDMENLLEDAIIEFSWSIGNPKLIKGKVDYYVTTTDEEYSRLGRNKDLYRNILTNLLGVDKKDSGQTVSAKIRAFIDGREYKPTKPKEKTKVYSANRVGYTILEGDKVKLHNSYLVLVKNNNEYQLIEPLTGLLIMKNPIKEGIFKRLKGTTYYKDYDFYIKTTVKGIAGAGIVPKQMKESGVPYIRHSLVPNTEGVQDFADSVYKNDTIGVEFLLVSLTKDIHLALDKENGVIILTDSSLDDLKKALDAFNTLDNYKTIFENKLNRYRK